MSTTEALRTQLDALRLEKQRLEVENARLREANPEGAAQTDAETEMVQCRAENERLTREAVQLRTLYEQLLCDVQEEQAKGAKKEEEMAERQGQDAATISKLHADIDQQGERLQGWEAECERLQAEVKRAQERMELECPRAVTANSSWQT